MARYRQLTNPKNCENYQSSLSMGLALRQTIQKLGDDATYGVERAEMSGSSASFPCAWSGETGRGVVRVDNPKSLRYEALAFMKISVVSVSFLFGRTALIVILTLLAGPAFAKRKDDVVVMKNGDRFTGEIKGLQHGELIFKAAYMVDSVRLDWNRVERLESKDSYIVALSSGARVTGNIERETIARELGSEVGSSRRLRQSQLNPRR